uniref:Uncharacterized protein n=1 Tax=Los Azufres archaeal virus 2 TaxID=1425359 RepID=A0A0A0P5X2_9VIRU|nr:hypothetical protein [Los Azufres archaeal virus 2]
MRRPNVLFIRVINKVVLSKFRHIWAVRFDWQERC